MNTAIWDTVANLRLGIDFATANVVVSVQKGVCDQLLFMGEEDAQTVGCPFIIIIDPGDIFPLRQHNRLVTYRARPAVNVVVNVSDTRIVEGGDVLLKLFPGRWSNHPR